MRPAVASLLGLVVAWPLFAEDLSGLPGYGYSSYGVPGLVDMPTAESAPDAELQATISSFAGSTRATLSFQLTPRLSTSFRYSKIDSGSGGALFDRSFDLRYRFLDEGRLRPAVAIGLQDFIGTGVYSAEYLVATKRITPRLSFTGGIGWGRLGSHQTFTNPLGALDARFETRPDRDWGRGGELEAGQWFRGDAALFGGVAYQATDRLRLKLEYSSDAYRYEMATGRGFFERQSPFNFGIDYELARNLQLQLYAMHGTEVGLAISLGANPRKPEFNGGTATAPQPVWPRPAQSAADLGWTFAPELSTSLRDETAGLLATEGLVLLDLSLAPGSARVVLRNDRYRIRAQAIGRAARVLTRTLPPSIEDFVIVPVESGIAVAEIRLRRSDLEELEFAPDGSEAIQARTELADTYGSQGWVGLRVAEDPRLRWSLGPYVQGSYFDPDNPVRLDFGAQLAASYDLAPGLRLSGQVRARMAGNRDQATRQSDSVLPRVRSEANLYAKTDVALTDLTLAQYVRPGPNLYGRLTLGYLEPQYAGVSGEILWKPVDSRLALGVELNHVRQRAFDQGFGLRDYETTTGHVSAYYELANGFHGRVDAGRYLAGDWGTTLTLGRRFANGWSVSAYATLTDVSFEDFGEGSFDKGIRITIPLEALLGKPTRETRGLFIQPITRDGGARVNVDGRLYGLVQSWHGPALADGWGRFWR